MLTYKRAHERIAEAKGRAVSYTCHTCPSPATSWAYQYNEEHPLVDPEGRPYSLNVENYKPMCAKCHRQFDIDSDPRVGAVARENGRLRGEANRDRLRVDPKYAAKMRLVNQRAVKRVQSQKRRCMECGLASQPGPMGRHFKASGHVGYEDRKG